MIISSVEPQAKDKARVNIFVDDEFYCGLELIVSMEYGLKAGKEITEEKLKEAMLKSDGETAFKRAMGFIGIRMRSIHELKEYLFGKGYPECVVIETIEKLKKYGYAGDKEFVAHYVSLYCEKRGIKRMREELYRFGIHESLINDALCNLDQTKAAKKALEKYLKTHSFDKQKVYTHLLSKGFEGDVILRVINGDND